MSTKVLMVCLGNICRSPLAEGIFRSLADKNAFVVDSAGTANYHSGTPPDTRSIAVAAKHGIDISNLRARQISRNDLDKFDHILVMDEQNLLDVQSLCNSDKQRQKVVLLTTSSGVDATHVPDPYYGNDQDFEAVFSLIQKSCVAWLTKH